MKTDIINRIVLLRYITAIIIGLTVGMGAEATTAMETKYIISVVPGILSMIFLVTSLISVFQFVMTKLSFKWSLWAPVIYDLITIPIVFILFLYQQYLYMLIFQIGSEAISSTLFLNRKNKIVEYIKEHYKMDKFFNMITSLFALGNILGYILSYSLIKLGVQFETLWICDFIVWVVPIFPILFYENSLLKEEIK